LIDTASRSPNDARIAVEPEVNMALKLTYAIHFVADMNRAVAFYRDTLGLTLKSASPGWSEFATGETTLALHPASAENPAGSTHLGFGTPDVQAFHQALTAAGVRFTRAPEPLHGVTLAEFVDSEGGRCSVSG
jgi:predicted enzyme related to lactoylglutathione lyase